MIGERLLTRFAGHVWHPLDSSEPAASQPGGAAEGGLGMRDVQRSDDMPDTVIRLEEESITNVYFRQVLYTGAKIQLVLMALLPGEDIGVQTYPNTDQVIRVESGCGRAEIEGEGFDLEAGSAIVIPAGAEHNIINTSPEAMLKLHAMYTPPEHPDGTVHRTKAEAQQQANREHA
jgi:mannose-6-phosphate isomerase-like protein (cupin superfamily)